MTKRNSKTRNGIGSSPRLSWRRILAPIDFSKTSLRALEVAARLACDHEARIFLLFAMEPTGYLAGMESVAMVVPDAVLEKKAKENLPRIAKRFIPPPVPVTVMVDRGRASDVITRVAREEKIDLIVLSTHGRTGLDRVLMGSTAEHVVRQAPCPVFVVRPAVGSVKKHKKRKD
jgi:nucleotide-binding universal stress UspA family protein